MLGKLVSSLISDHPFLDFAINEYEYKLYSNKRAMGILILSHENMSINYTQTIISVNKNNGTEPWKWKWQINSYWYAYEKDKQLRTLTISYKKQLRKLYWHTHKIIWQQSSKHLFKKINFDCRVLSGWPDNPITKII